MAEAVLMDLTAVCSSFPELPTPLIVRDNILDTLENILSGDSYMAIVEGAEGIGKTTLLAQFARRYPDNVFSLFIRPTSRWAYDPDILRWDLCSQLQWALYKKPLHEDVQVDDVYLRNRIYQLQKRVKQLGTNFYFVVDGLGDIPGESGDIQGRVLDMLPIGLPGMKVVLSSCPQKGCLNLPRGIVYKPFVLPGFSTDEALRYFSDLTISRDQVEEIYRTCKHTPQNLASVRRLLMSGTKIDQLTDNFSDKLPDLFRLEWDNVDLSDRRLLDLLGVLTFDRREHTISLLSDILGLDKDTIDDLLAPVSFITIDSSRSQKVGFVSEAFRRFSAERLKDYRDAAHEIIIEHLMKDPTSDAALTYLPSYLHQAGKRVELLMYLSPDRFAEMLGKCQSLGLVEQKAELGIVTSLDAQRDGDLMRFCIQRSGMADLTEMQLHESEVEAYVAVGDYDAAIALAQGTVLKENRLRLLALIARRKLDDGLTPEPELDEQLRQLCKQVDAQRLGNQIVKIATDLVHLAPDLAVELVEQATEVDSDFSRDEALATLSIAAGQESSRHEEAAENIRLRIKDPKALRASRAGSLLFGNYPAAKVVSELEKLDSPTDRIYLSRQWILANLDNVQAIDVVEYALNLALRTSTYTPTARFFRELAMALPGLSDHVKARQIVGVFDSQLGGAQALGPTEDLIWLQLLLAQTVARYDRESARSRIADVYLSTTEIDDLSVRATCLARLIETLALVDPDHEYEERDELHSLANNDFWRNLHNLLDQSADHDKVTEGAIRALAIAEPNIAIDVALRLNTEKRRDRGLLHFTEAAIEATESEFNVSTLTRALHAAVGEDTRDTILIKVIERVADLSNRDLIRECLPLIDLIKTVRDAEQRCRIFCLAQSMLREAGDQQFTVLADQLLARLREAWNCIDVVWSKVNAGFKITEALAQASLGEAQCYLEETRSLRRDLVVDDITTATTYAMCIQLALRAYGALLSKNLEIDDDLENLSGLIRRIPSQGIRAEVWAELAVRCHLNGNHNACSSIVMDYVKPLFEGVPTEDTEYRDQLMVRISPALYFSHRKTALEAILRLPHRLKDRALAAICRVIFNKVSFYDPYEIAVSQAYDIQYTDIVDVCELLGLMDDDGDIYYYIKCIANSVERHRKERFTQQVQADIANRLGKISSHKFPNARSIMHEGYGIVSEAQIARISQVRGTIWDDLVVRARSIPNTADQSYVLCEIAVCLPSKEHPRRSVLLEEIGKLLSTLPAVYDKIEHYRSFAEIIFPVDSQLAKEYLRLAMRVSVNGNSSDISSAQRRIIDVAHRINPEFAETLASELDDDPARRAARERIRQRLEVLKLKKSMLERSTSRNNEIISPSSEYPQAAWMTLGALNADRTSPLRSDELREYLQTASRMPMKEAYPIYAWAIENVARRPMRPEQARATLRPMFEATLLGAQLAGRLAARTLTKLDQGHVYRFQTAESASTLIRPGERTKALEFLRRWFEENVRDYVKVCDPYFGPADLEVLQVLRSVVPACRAFILTSKKHQDNEGVRTPWEEAYQSQWVQISDQNPPDTDIVIVGTRAGGELPIHDRWWLTKGGGLRIGTSFRSLGLGKDSEISILSAAEAAEREIEVDGFLTHSRREHNGDKLLFTRFNL